MIDGAAWTGRHVQQPGARAEGPGLRGGAICGWCEGRGILPVVINNSM